MQPLDPNQMPLHGRRLIEASAGTGKTFTLAALYLRLLLECEHTVDQILVVTFTEAATEELRGRIRARIRQMVQRLQGGRPADPHLEALVATTTPERALPLLDAALKRMDEAAIFTIHGFCRRMLAENAFESGLTFDHELVTDLAELEEEAVHTFWRTRCYPMDTRQARWMRGQWPTPGALQANLRGWLGREAGGCRLPVGLDGFDAEMARHQTQFAALAAHWAADGATVRDLLLGSKALNGNSYKTAQLPAWLDALEAWFTAGDATAPPPARVEKFTPAELERGTKKNQTTPTHPLFEQLAAYLQRPDTLRAQMLAEAHTYLRQRLGELKAVRNLLGFDDLLTLLDRALQAPAGGRLAERVRGRFPVALIDEFQDTDPTQYRIFDTLYPPGGEASLFLVGDPKQAIYGFRGADIFAYLAARDATPEADAQFTLETNWRSVTPLVAGVNALFAQHQEPFVLARGIPFHAVQAAGASDAEPFTYDGASSPPITLYQLTRDHTGDDKSAPSKERAYAAILEPLADEIAELLNAAGEGRARLGERPLAARDIAVLVATHSQARRVQRVLHARGVASAYQGRASVFASVEAEELERVLQAVNTPGHAGRLRAALATGLLGYSAARLDALQGHELAWEGELVRFADYLEVWRHRGVMALLQRLLIEQQIPTRLLTTPDGERRITDLLQLGELLQEAQGRHHGQEALLRWFEEQRRAPNGDEEAQQLRLESDAPLVKVITIHKSKGLEFPLVFLPFLWARGQERSEPPRTLHDADGRACLDFGSEVNEHLARWREEGLAEQLRLLYVALTRARNRCVLVWGDIAGAGRSGLAWLLHGEPGLDELALEARFKALGDDAIGATLRALAESHPESFHYARLPEARFTPFQGHTQPPDLTPARVFAGELRPPWRIGSYTTLASGIHVAPPNLPELPDHDAQGPDVSSRADLPGEHLDRFSFPRGARAGTLLHSLFELIDFTQVGREDLLTLAERQLQRFGFESKWSEVLADWVLDVLATPLDASGLSLRQVSTARRLVELEFYLPVRHLDAVRLDRLCAEGFGRDDLPPLKPQQLDGLLKGFIDLVFEADGRWYVVDYKSNWLGDTPAAYSEARVAEAIFAHRYELQYVLYTLALHRYLQRRLPAYDPERHLGGVRYLFLRGMPEAGVHAVAAPLEMVLTLERWLVADNRA